MSQSNKSVVHELKQKADKCMKEGSYAEAFFHLTHALKLSPQDQDTSLYFMRSKCFLKQDQYYYALKDAEELIRRDPTSTQVV